MKEKYFHITSLSPLYEDVQQSGIFADSKYFVDAVPKVQSSIILKNYTAQKRLPSFDLRTFIQDYFEFPATNQQEYSSAEKSITVHLHELWNVLQRNPDETGGTLIGLPFPYIVPGGRFREIYYWDSYFTMLGLELSGRMDLVENMVKNFAYLINETGHIPNGNRTYYISRSQPPFFAMMVSLLASVKGNQVFTDFLPVLEKEYGFWMQGVNALTGSVQSVRRVVKMPDGLVLNRYWDDDARPRPEAYIEDIHVAAKSNKDPEIVYRHIRAAAESGWDFSSRWFADEKQMHTIQTTDIIPVDLNCLLLYLEQVLQNCYLLKQDTVAANKFKEKINNRAKAIQQYCWNKEQGFYFDYHFIEQKMTERITVAGCFPLFTGLANEQQANAVATVIKEKLLAEGGILTSTTVTGQQWDAPNGWAPLQWVTFKGLSNYGHSSLANQIRERWMKLNEKTYAETGKMMEKYNVADTNTKAGGGEYPNQDGFGWTNGVYLAFRKSIIH